MCRFEGNYVEIYYGEEWALMRRDTVVKCITFISCKPNTLSLYILKELRELGFNMARFCYCAPVLIRSVC